MSGRRLTGRDFKRNRRGSGLAEQAGRLRDLGIGLVIGLCIAGAFYLAAQRVTDNGADLTRPVPHKLAAADGSRGAVGAPELAPATEPPGADDKYDFYEMLPKFEVVVPEKERGTRTAPAAQIDRPGVYFLQVGSYRDQEVAERIRAQLTKLGVDSTVQRVAVDSDVWHRVRIGPIRDLARLNRLRQQLHASDLDSLVVRVDE